jgi:cadmium resistance protein CadD (predicted permease)
MEIAMSFGLYLAGYFVVIIGLGYAAHLAHVPDKWMIAGVLIMIGIGIITAVTKTRQKDPN